MTPKVLFVDDEPSTLELLRRSLRNEKYVIFTASSAVEALAVMKKQQIDVVVSDEVMPGMSGTDLLAMIRRLYPGTIRIILTGHPDVDVIAKAMSDGGVYRFFTKPWNKIDLAVTISQAIAQKRLAEKHRNLKGEYKKQAEALDKLEKQHPGITKLNTDADGVIVIDDVDDADEILLSFR